MAIIAIISLVINFVTFVFLVSYLFFWKKMRAWFNNKAEMDFMPEKRINPDIKPTLIVGAIFAILVIIFNIAGKDDLIEMSSSVACLGITVWSIYKYKQLKPIIGEKAAKWAAIFHFGSTTTIIGLTIFLAVLVAMACIALFLFGKAADFGISSMSPSSSSSSSSSSDSNDTIVWGASRTTDDGEDISVDKREDGTYRDSSGREYTENLDGSLHEKH